MVAPSLKFSQKSRVWACSQATKIVFNTCKDDIELFHIKNSNLLQKNVKNSNLLQKVRILYMTDILKGSHYPQSLCNDSFVGFLTPRVFTYANAPSKMAKQPMSLPTTSFAGEI